MTVTYTATDAHNNTASGSFTVSLKYAWTGFFQSVDNGNVVNKAKAGQSIPIKFSLGGNQGPVVLAAGRPAFVQGNVPPADANDDVETYATSVPGLTYDPTSGQYTYVWKTDKALAGKSGTFVLKLGDGSVHTTLFTFSK
jgi:hypothetical protein